jgi:hypothetical protein
VKKKVEEFDCVKFNIKRFVCLFINIEMNVLKTNSGIPQGEKQIQPAYKKPHPHPQHVSVAATTSASSAAAVATAQKSERRERESESDSYERTRDREEERDSREDDHHEEDDHDDERTTKYKLSNLITLFHKSGIKLLSIFTYSKRVMLLQILHNEFEYCLYIPSKYEMYIDRSSGIPTYEMADDEEDAEEEDTLFYNGLPIQNLRREKKSKSKSLARFMPLVTESPFKMIYIDESFVSYITRNNEIDSLLLVAPFKTSGYFYLTDLEFFFKNLNRVTDEMQRFERALNDAVYDKLTTEIDSAKKAVQNAQKMLATLNPKAEKAQFAAKVTKLNKYVKHPKYQAKASKMLIKLRNQNLDKMFDLEHLAYVMKEF